MNKEKITKKMGLKSLVILLITFMMILNTSFIFAKESEEKIEMPQGSFVVEKGMIHENDEFFKIIPGVYNKGRVKGNLVFYTADFINRGIVDGNIIGIASTFNSDGEINNDVIGYFNSVYLNDTKLNGDLKVYGETFIINDHSIINGDILVYGNDVEIRGQIKGNVTIVSNKVLLDARIDGNVRIGSNDFVVGKQAKIGGDITYQSSTPMVKSPGSKILGKTEQKNLGYTIGKGNNFNNYINELLAGYALLITMSVFIIAVIIFKLFPLSSFKFDIYIKNHIFKNSVTGAVAALLIMPLTFFLALTIVGIPLSLSLISIYLNLLYIGKIPAALLVGRLFIRRDGALSIKLIIGLLVLQLLTYLPFGIINTIIILIFNMFGLGAIIQIIFTIINKHYKKEKMEYNTLINVIMNNKKENNHIKSKEEIKKNIYKIFKEEETQTEDDEANEDKGDDDER